MYTAPVADIAERHGVNYHLYADDIQLYVPLDNTLGTASYQKESIEKCVVEIVDWMNSNKLKLNSDKTNVIVFGTNKALIDLNFNSVQIKSSSVPVSSSLKNLGCYLDANFTMSCQINNICQQSYYHLKNTGMIRSYINKDTAQLLVSSLVMSRIDYCNSLLAGVSLNSIIKLQRVQNQAARNVPCAKKHQHITPVLKDLHRLPVKQRIDFKVLTFVHNFFQNTSPFYIQEILECHRPNRVLRSSGNNKLAVPRSHSTLGDRTFSIYSPIKWNALPASASLKLSFTHDNFKRHLKTFLFKQAFV